MGNLGDQTIDLEGRC